MRRLWRLPAAVVEFSVGTTIVMIHAALADRERRQKLQHGHRPIEPQPARTPARPQS